MLTFPSLDPKHFFTTMKQACFFAGWLLDIGGHQRTSAAEIQIRPNVVLILADDQGYSDIGVYGAEGFSTPNLDRLGREGIRFTAFPAAQGGCSASRAALGAGV